LDVLDKILDSVFPNRYKKYQARITDDRERIDRAYFELTELYHKDEYFTRQSHNVWRNKWDSLSEPVRHSRKIRRKLDNRLNEELDLLYSAFHEATFLKERNGRYVESEISRNQDYFNKLERYPLTQGQCRAIVTDETRNLVVAGAGTGKTSTLLGKAGYVLRRGFAKPDEILLLSFGKDNVDEMLERARKGLGLPLEANTYHALGLRIIADTENRKPNVSKLSEDSAALLRFIDDIINRKKAGRNFLKNLNDFFLHTENYSTEWDFKTQNEYFQYLKSQDLRSLKGDRVRSHQELEIANFLYLNGIEYEYEQQYEFPTASKLHGQYRPDFYLPTYKIYLEHFGVDRFGNTAPFVDREKYQEEMHWKRGLHKEHGTVLVETYSYEALGGGLQSHLARKLTEKGVQLNPIPEETVYDKLNDLGRVKPISRLLATFLSLYKSNNMNVDELKRKARESENPSRANAFVGVFIEVLAEYQKDLDSRNEVDFDDMIIKATEYLNTGKVKLASKYVLVDEFQDISQSRYRFLKAILDQNPQSRLFAVGDDWQSIFRFAGSDPNVMTQFEKYLGASEPLFIDRNFRFNDKICDFSTKFILENPSQISKRMRPNEVVKQPAVSICYTKDPQVEIERILSQLNNVGGSVQLLGRYRKQETEIPPRYPKLHTEFLTVHKSKGTEADYVIVLGLESGIMGFPCEITDDLVLKLVTSEPDSFPHAEERRLFYVAITRARKHVYLLVDPENPSTFITEILRNGYEVELTGEPMKTFGKCPECGGMLVKKKGDNGDFYPCDNYPYCDYKAPRCPSCEGYLLPRYRGYMCEHCNATFEACPDCGGALIPKNGPYSRFLGCSNFPGCHYKAQLTE